MEIAQYYPALILGLGGSLHCVGMCGPIVLTLHLDKQFRNKMLIQNLVYQLGRVTTYALLGLFIIPINHTIKIGSWQGWISIFIGVLMILSSLLNAERWLNRFWAKKMTKPIVKLKLKLQQYIQQNSYQSLYITGILNGLLPCGMVINALVSSIGVNGTGYESVIYMFLFGIGTLPLMYFIVMSKELASNKWNKTFEKLIPCIVAIVGIILLIKGYKTVFMQSSACH